MDSMDYTSKYKPLVEPLVRSYNNNNNDNNNNNNNDDDDDDDDDNAYNKHVINIYNTIIKESSITMNNVKRIMLKILTLCAYKL